MRGRIAGLACVAVLMVGAEAHAAPAGPESALRPVARAFAAVARELIPAAAER